MNVRRLVFLSALLCAGLALPAEAHAPAPELSESIRGVWIRSVPAQTRLRLGSRQIRPGDVLTAEQLSRLTVDTEHMTAIRILPVGSHGPERETVLSLRGTPNQPPIAADSAAETYRNLPMEAVLDVRDPEQEPLTFQLIRPPRRGTVILRKDGSFLYTPEKNQIGTDSFTYCAADPGGKRSREAAVTVKILPASADRPYSDTDGNSCRFAAEWLRETGIFVGETVDGIACFSPDRPMTREQFLPMLMAVLKLPADRTAESAGLPPDTPLWLRPYLAAALRSGILRPREPEASCSEPLTLSGAEALVCSAAELALPGKGAGQQTIAHIRAACGFPDACNRLLTRSDAAEILLSLSRLIHPKVLISSQFGK